MKSFPGAPGVYLSLSEEQVQWSLNFERSRVNPRNENESSTKSELARCDVTSMIQADPVKKCGLMFVEENSFTNVLYCIYNAP